MPTTTLTRRQALKTAAFAGVSLATTAVTRRAFAQGDTNAAANPASNLTMPAPVPSPAVPSGPFTLPPLPYAYDALEPHIDARTMQIHHDKHHAAYVANLNKAVADYPDLGKVSVEDLLKDLNAIPAPIRTAIRNQGGGHYNHSLFWQMLGGASAGMEENGPTGPNEVVLAKAMASAFGSFASFKEQFTKAAVTQFGSGWAWLVLDANKQLVIDNTANQDSPISQGAVPLLGIDVWEHSYYLKYQNRRPDYVAAFFHVINWDYVAERYGKFTS